LSAEKQLVTEGNLYYTSSYSGNVSFDQTTSVLNTPFFVNSIQKGVELQKQKSTYPYTKAAYLLLNSLPLITGKEKLNSTDQNQKDFDYIFATLKKYGAVHKLPYAWILKIGSVYHRYKKYINENIDILSDVWDNFDYVNNYDPLSGSTTTPYKFTANTIEYNVVLQSNSNNLTKINLGFYPKLFNDFSYFYLGKEVIKNTYTSNDIQQAINKKDLNLLVSDAADITFPNGVDSSNPLRTINVTSWSSFVSANTNSFYLLPSVGGINQTKVECFNNSNVQASARLKIELLDNEAMYNGSVRNFWFAPNFGYFDVGKIVRPRYDNHFKQVKAKEQKQENFSINRNVNDYSKIDELFSIFNSEILNYFEEEFLNFSKAATNFSTKLVDAKSQQLKYYNFQLLMQSMMKITIDPNSNSANNNQAGNSSLSSNNSNVSSNSKIIDYATLQANQINNTLKGFLEEDVYFVYGNPSSYDKKLFYSFSDLSLVDKFTLDGYSSSTPNAVPTSNGSITLSQSKVSYPLAWKTLETYVGFSTIPQLQYKDSGSFITDFFVDFNVAFTEQNIKQFAPIIKLYATQKLNQNQTNPINTNQAINADILLYQANLSNGNTIEITQNVSNKIVTIRDTGLPRFTNNSPSNLDIQQILNNTLSLPQFNGISISEVTFEQSQNNFPNNPNSSVSSGGAEAFKTKMNNYLTSYDQEVQQIINTFWPRLSKELGSVSVQPKKTDISQLQGDPQTKLELWEMFKSLNDKWISGNDFKTKTLFEDVLLVDRASRNVGEKVLIDIFSLKELFDPSKINLKTDVITFVESILVMNNFVVMTLPSYVNFYGVQNVSGNDTPKPEGTLDFANTLFGTFTNVDYRDSSTKLVCQFLDRPSEYINLEDNPDFRFRDDSFDIENEADNPVSENLQGKTDYGLSNKVVGFNVEIGVQNQQIFKNFSVGQNSGLATSEALEILNQMANQGGHRNVATQNMSLYTLYKNRSYTCNLSMMGNALIQPTMYFNLKYVPMFSGPYMITEVNHSISQGEFNTDIVGIRQPVASMPILDNYLQGLRTNLVKKLDEKLEQNAKNNPQPKSVNVITEQAVVGSRDNNSSITNQNPNCKVEVSQYNFLSPVDVAVDKTTVSFTDMKSEINQGLTTPNEKLAKLIFSYFYFQNGIQNGFEANYNNFGGVDLLQYWGTKSENFFGIPQYWCKSTNPPPSSSNANNNNTSQQTNKVTPMAVFGTLDLSIKFFVSWWSSTVLLNSVDISSTDTTIVATNIAEFFLKYRNPDVVQSDSFIETYKKNNQTQYAEMVSRVKTAIEKYDIS
jgi:hypothetical protein